MYKFENRFRGLMLLSRKKRHKKEKKRKKRFADQRMSYITVHSGK